LQVNPRPLSLAKAKKEGIRMVKLPVEKYLDWGSGSTKSFTMNQMMSVLLDLKYTGDWNIAFKNIPTRKLRAAREHKLKYLMNRIEQKYDDTKTDVQDFTFASRRKNSKS